MKRYFLYFIAFGLLSSLIFSCSKDSSLNDNISVDEPKQFNAKQYNAGGALLNKAIAVAMDHPDFRQIVAEQALIRDAGDTEFLLKDIMDKEVDGQKINQFLAEQFKVHFDNPSFNQEYLNEFLAAFPTFLVGVRGDIDTWDVEAYQPNVVFATTDFKEEDLSIAGFDSKGKKITQGLEVEPEQVFIALHMSERHDENGVNLYKLSLQRNNALQSANNGNGAVNLDDVAVDLRSCPPEPAGCAGLNIPTPSISSANADMNGININYNRPAIMVGSDNIADCYITKYYIYLNGVLKKVQSGTSSPFYSIPASTLDPNTTYSITIRTAVLTESGYCFSSYSSANSVTTPNGMLSPPDSFNGLNLTSSSIEYTWNNPSGSDGTKIELYDDATGNWNTLANLSGGDIDYTQFYSSSDRGTLQWVRARSESGYGTLSNASYDVNYAGWRSDGQVLMLEGFQLTNHLDIQYRNYQSYVYGLPEFYLSATMGAVGNGGATSATQLHEQTQVFVIGKCSNSGNVSYYIDRTPIINQWYNTFHNNVITVNLIEFDGIIGGSSTYGSTNSQSFTLGAKIPIKIVEVNAGITFENSTTSSTTITYANPDINLGNQDIYYWNYPDAGYTFANGLKMVVSNNGGNLDCPGSGNSTCCFRIWNWGNNSPIDGQ